MVQALLVWLDGDNESGDVLIRARSNATSLPTDSDTKLILTGAGDLGLAINNQEQN